MNKSIPYSHLMSSFARKLRKTLGAGLRSLELSSCRSTGQLFCRWSHSLMQSLQKVCSQSGAWTASSNTEQQIWTIIKTIIETIIKTIIKTIITKQLILWISSDLRDIWVRRPLRSQNETNRNPFSIVFYLYFYVFLIKTLYLFLVLIIISLLRNTVFSLII